MPPSTLIELLAAAAKNCTNQNVYSFTNRDGLCLESITSGNLHTRAAAVAVKLQSVGQPGDRVMLICNPGLQTATAFWGCLYAGFVAVPVSPPANKNCDRLQAVADDSGARLVIGALGQQVEALLNAPDGRIKNVNISEVDDSSSALWETPALNGETLAFLQYTSGSTGTPKGVMVSHKNLLSNAQNIEQAFELTPEDRALFWLPLFHDMGLMGGVVQPIYSGYSTIFLSPSSFISDPLNWLDLIGKYKITVSGGPNFAYDSCARLGPRDEYLDLSSWRIAFNGSEAVRAETVKRFVDTFAPHGFKPSALRPCYGLAEATLLVSAGSFDGSALSVDAELLRRGQIKVAPENGNAKSLIGVGSPCAGQSVLIVDPEKSECCDENQVGEIWVAGSSMAQGYWGRPKETELSFRARPLPITHEPYLRTGDLGFFLQKELFITGRLKDLIIIGGQNYYPHDIEATVQSSHRALRRGCGAVFAADFDGEERLVVVQELTRQGLKEDHDKVISAIRRQIFDEHRLNPYSVVLIRTATLPKTTSGKIQRRACLDAYTANVLEIVSKSELEATELLVNPVVARPALDSASRAREIIEQRITQLTGASFSDLDPAMLISAMGMDSLHALELKTALQHLTGSEISIAKLLSNATIADLRHWMESGLKTTLDEMPSYTPSDKGGADEFPLSAGQRALWFVQQLEPEDTSLTIARLCRIRGRLNRATLRAAFDLIVQRHSSLRMTIRMRDGEPYQRIASIAGICMEEHDAHDWSEPRLAQHAREQVKIAFDLANGPVLRTHCYVCSDFEARLLLCAHHIAVDLRSLIVIAEELSVIYEALEAGNSPQLPEPCAHYRDFVEAQTSMLNDETGGRLWKYWHERLNNAPPALDLTIGRSGSRSGPPGNHRFELAAEMVRALKGLARTNGATLHAVLLAVFELLLSRYSGRSRMLLGVLSSGRTQWAWKDIIGYFVNPVVLCTSVDGNSVFSEHLRRSREQLLEAIDHADYPFATLVERLHVGRSGRRAAPVEVMCMLQPSISVSGNELASLAMGCAGSSFKVGDLVFESMESDFDGLQFDLVFAAAESGDRVQLAFRYKSNAFAADSIVGLAADYCTLLKTIVSDPQKPLAWLPMLDAEREYEVIRKWNATAQPAFSAMCIHEAIEQQVNRAPQCAAIICESTQMSYAELNGRANQLARYLIRCGVGPESRVGVYLGRSPELLIAILASLKTGGAYVPLDPEYPIERTLAVLENAQLSAVISTKVLSRRIEPTFPIHYVHVDQVPDIANFSTDNVKSEVTPDNLAYVIHTSGSTGRPKGVMISHRNVANFFYGMDQKIGCGPNDTLVAVTSLAFDISVLELMWTLSRGCRVVLVKEQTMNSADHRQGRIFGVLERLRFSLFYFASSDAVVDEDRYQLLLEGAKLADRLGFEAVWTPERHFHPFGGLYPNPSVTSAALATVTTQIKLRAGSVVLPLQNPIRVAEEWSVVDNLSQGRVGIAFASGWHADDFVFYPENYQDRRRLMLEGIEAVRRLWRGEAVPGVGGSGRNVEVSTYPRPKQKELPIWLTSGGSPETFVTAAEIDANILTHLLGQDINDVSERVSLYRRSLEGNGTDPATRTVTLMLHTYLDETEDQVRKKALGPFKQYLNSSFDLITNLIRTLNLNLDINKMTEKDRDDLLTFAAERYLSTSGLFGTPESCLPMLDQLAQMGVNEVACLVDFGVDTRSAIQSIDRIHELRQRLLRRNHTSLHYSVAAQAARYGATMLQCTPSLLRVIAHESGLKEAVGSMRTLMLGGETVPATLVEDFAQTGVRNIFNMYGPTETTIWSSILKLDPSEREVLIGSPIANTQIYILNDDLMAVPNGVLGELYIAGSGLARGYFRDPALTAERFLPNPFALGRGERLYRSGDLGRRREDGRIELLGRSDQQVKIRGHRIELGDIEMSLNLAPGVRVGVALKVVGEDGDERLNAYLVPAEMASIDTGAVREFLKSRLPQYMMPSVFHVISRLPLTANGKIDRRALSSITIEPSAREVTSEVLPQTNVESEIAKIWTELLGNEVISVDDNFFDIGGHSLLMVQVHHKVQQMLGRDFPLVTMLEHPTIRSIAGYLDGMPREEARVDQERALEQRSAFLLQREQVLAVRRQG